MYTMVRLLGNWLLVALGLVVTTNESVNQVVFDSAHSAAIGRVFSALFSVAGFLRCGLRMQS